MGIFRWWCEDMFRAWPLDKWTTCKMPFIGFTRHGGRPRSEPVHSFVRVQLTILLLQTSYFNTPAKRVIKHFLVTRRTNVVRDSNSGEMGKFKHLRVLAGPKLEMVMAGRRCCWYIKVSMLLSSSPCSAPYQTCKQRLTRPRLFMSSYSYSEALSNCQPYINSERGKVSLSDTATLVHNCFAILPLAIGDNCDYRRKLW